MAKLRPVVQAISHGIVQPCHTLLQLVEFPPARKQQGRVDGLAAELLREAFEPFDPAVQLFCFAFEQEKAVVGVHWGAGNGEHDSGPLFNAKCNIGPTIR